jgi:hypothetical protein
VILKQRATRPIERTASTTRQTRRTAWSSAKMEARWNKALAHVVEVETKIVAHQASGKTPVADPACLANLTDNVGSVRTAPLTDARLKKRIVRTLINQVIADIDDVAAEIVLVVHWIGGIHSEMRLPKRRLASAIARRATLSLPAVISYLSPETTSLPAY